MKKSILLSILSILLLNACFKEDDRVLPYPGIIYSIVDSVQKYTSYFDLESERIVKSHPADDWQLGFESSSEGWHINTNSGDSWFLYNTRSSSIPASAVMPQGLIGMYDVHHAWPDSTASGNWVTFNSGQSVYTNNIYFLGHYRNGIYEKIKALKFIAVSETSYLFSWYDYNTLMTDTVSIIKDTAVNFVYYSFNRNEQVNLEPPKSEYDLVFCSYYDMATNFGITMPYLVGGAFQNIWKTSALLDTVNHFEELELSGIDQTRLLLQRDLPGYNWKVVTVDVTGGGSATYDVKTNYNYVFKTVQGNIYKLRFLSYSIDGQSGHPQFEFRLMK